MSHYQKWRKLGGLSCYGKRPKDMLSKYVEWLSHEISTWEKRGMREEVAKKHKDWLEQIGQRQG